MDEAIAPRKLGDAIADRVVEAIVAGRYRPGDYLPNEQEMAQRFSVSRTVVREALRTLAARRPVDVQHGRGAVVTRGPDAALSRIFETELRRERGTLIHLYEVRRVLETAVVALAAERATDDDLRRMGEALAAMRASSNAESYIRADLAFHKAIVEAAHNPILSLLNEALAGLLREARKRTYDLPGAVAHSLVDHADLYAAIAAHDRAAALRRIEEVMNRIQADLALLDDRSGPSSDR